MAQDECGAVNEHGTHHDEQQHGEYHHCQPCPAAQEVAHDFGQSGTVEPEREHSGQVVVDRSGEDTAQHYPQVSRRTEFRSHDGTEYRARAGNVEELHHIYFPRGHGDIVHPVGMCQCRRRALGIGLHDAFHQTTIKNIAHDEG